MDKFLTTLPNSVQIYTGAIADIPAGYALCNGQIVNGIQTPDLTTGYIRAVSEIPINEVENSYLGTSLNYATPLPSTLSKIETVEETEHTHAVFNNISKTITEVHNHGSFTVDTRVHVNVRLRNASTAGGGNEYNVINWPQFNANNNNNGYNDFGSQLIEKINNFDTSGAHNHTYANASNRVYSENYNQANGNTTQGQEGESGPEIPSHIHTFSESDDVTEPVNTEVLFIMWVGY